MMGAGASRQRGLLDILHPRHVDWTPVRRWPIALGLVALAFFMAVAGNGPLDTFRPVSAVGGLLLGLSLIYLHLPRRTEEVFDPWV